MKSGEDKERRVHFNSGREDADGVQGQCSKTCNSQKEPLFSQDMWVYWEIDG